MQLWLRFCLKIKMRKTQLAIVLMLICTAVTSIAQIFYKFGAMKLPEIITNYNLLLGLALYAFGAVILMIAFKFGEVTVLFPIIATSYIWVALLSWFIFSDSMNVFKILGICAIVLGITTIALGSKKTSVVKFTEGV